MSTFRVSNGICDEFDSLERQFWWQSKPGGLAVALKVWDEFCKPKQHGGLGFRKFKDINLALLEKLGWKLANGEYSLWMWLFRAKYMNNGNFFFSSCCNNS